MFINDSDMGTESPLHHGGSGSLFFRNASQDAFVGTTADLQWEGMCLWRQEEPANLQGDIAIGQALLEGLSTI